MSDYYSSISPIFRRASPFVPPNFSLDFGSDAEGEENSIDLPAPLDTIVNGTRILVVGAGNSMK